MPDRWSTWLQGNDAEARALLLMPAVERLHPGVSRATDKALARRT